MNIEIYNNKENYNKFKDEVLNDFNYFFTFNNNLKCFSNLDIEFSDEKIAKSAFIELEKDKFLPTDTICKIYCTFLSPDTLSEEIAIFYFYPKHARILLGKEGNQKSVTLDRANKSIGCYDFKMILRNNADKNKECQIETDTFRNDNKVKFNLSDIYKHLKLWRKEKGIIVENEKAKYLWKVMRELGELSNGIKDRNNALIKRQELILKDNYTISERNEASIKIQQAEHKIIDALCNISILTINAGTDIVANNKITKIEDYVLLSNKTYGTLLNVCGNFAMSFCSDAFNGVLRTCAVLCHKLGFDYELAMLEKIASLGNNLTRYELARLAK